MRRTLLKYLLVEQLIPFCVSLLVLTLVLFLGRSLRYVQLLLASGPGLADLAKLLFYSLPYFFAFTIPMATLLAVLLAFARLANDNEITAMKAAGISLYQMIPPVALVVGSAWLLTLGLNLFVLPRGNTALRTVLLEMAQSRAHLGFKERVFEDQFTGLVFFINRLSPDGKLMHEVFISDERDPKTSNTIIAEEGALFNDPDQKRLTIRLFRGIIVRVGNDMHSAQTMRFQNYDFYLDLISTHGASHGANKDEAQLSFTELSRTLAGLRPGSTEHFKLSMEWHRRLALPFACVVLGFIAVPLILQSGSVTRFSGIVTGLFLFVIYYIMMSAAGALGEINFCPPAVGLWFPNVLFGLLAIVLWRQTAKEKTFMPISFARQAAALVLARIRKR
jgi:lipopolysaccharide export system permease protein